MARNPNQVRIVDKDRGICLQILYGEISMLEIRETPNKESDKDFFADNDDFIRAIWRVFKKAEELGYLKQAVRATDEDDEPFTEIEV